MSRMAKLRQVNHQTDGVTTLLAVYESHIESPTCLWHTICIV